MGKCIQEWVWAEALIAAVGCIEALALDMSAGAVVGCGNMAAQSADHEINFKCARTWIAEVGLRVQRTVYSQRCAWVRRKVSGVQSSR